LQLKEAGQLYLLSNLAGYIFLFSLYYFIVSIDELELKRSVEKALIDRGRE